MSYSACSLSHFICFRGGRTRDIEKCDQLITFLSSQIALIQIKKLEGPILYLLLLLIIEKDEVMIRKWLGLRKMLVE